MLRVRPSFFDDFTCIASACRHSCCIGWEIEVDDDTRAYYDGIGGELGRELREKLSAGEEPHFLLDEDERCPFLKENGLCRIILELGEDALCDICAEHPRFYNCLPGREESGLGLCCEETVRLLLEEKSFTLVEEDDDGAEVRDPFAERLAELRKEIDCVLQKRPTPFEQRLAEALHLFGTKTPDFDPSAWASFLLTLERMDERWTEKLRKLPMCSNAKWRELFDDERYERIFRYLIYRHLITAPDPEEAVRRLRFCAISAMTVCALDALEPQEKNEHLRLWSAEIEYSDENVRKICEKL